VSDDSKITVGAEALRLLCRLAREAGEELKAAAWREYPADHPVHTRRRNVDIAIAQEMIDAANAICPDAERIAP
jgi:hypothetical protein